MTPALATISAADLFGLVVATLVCVYLVYALLRGENL
jgi:K+-transporting ATPase KdpF subunit